MKTNKHKVKLPPRPFVSHDRIRAMFKKCSIRQVTNEAVKKICADVEDYTYKLVVKSSTIVLDNNRKRIELDDVNLAVDL